MKKILGILFLLLCVQFALLSKGKDSLEVKPTLTNEFLDTVVVNSPKAINDYSMIGFSYGGTFCNTYFNPTKVGSRFRFTPEHYAFTFTNYHKMFGMLPYFGIQFGLAYGKEGYSFELNDDDFPRGNVDGASECTIKVIEVPVNAHMHIDFARAKVMANVGIYGGYKLSIERSGPYLDKEFENKFFDYERRWDYGLQGGVGAGLMLDPFEIHLNATIRWGWQNIHEPDSNPFSQYPTYYYRFSYPLDLIVTVGIHYQLTKRTGRTTKALKKQAYEQVYGKAENN